MYFCDLAKKDFFSFDLFEKILHLFKALTRKNHLQQQESEEKKIQMGAK